MRFLIIFIVLTLTLNNAMSVSISYTLEINDPVKHYFSVKININGLDDNDDYIDLLLPVWRPGRYLIFDFASDVFGFRASAGSVILKWRKMDKSRWRIFRNGYSDIEISYSVYANEFHLRTKGLDTNHGFVNGSAVFMYPEKYRHHPVILKVVPYSNWHVTTGLKNKDSDPFLFHAPDYDYLIDCPLEIGRQDDFDFLAGDRKHTVSIFGKADYSKSRITNDFKRIIEWNHNFWGHIPYERYVFIIHCTPQSSGGTEHINSTVVGVRPSQFNSTDGYRDFLRLISHEFFHTWNVKQLKPAGLLPYDYTKENYTEELWIAEGATSYYDRLILVRTGLEQVGNFFNQIIGFVKDDRNRPGNRIQSLAESSFDAWIKFWKRNPHAYDTECDYYKKGSYVSMILDLEIRKSSENKYSLDDVFRYMYKNYALNETGYTNQDFISVSEKFAGRSLKEFFDRYLYGTEPIEWEKYLLYAGLELTADDTTIASVLGIRTSNKDGKIIVDDVLKGSSAFDAGIFPGDQIIALDGKTMPYEEMESKLQGLKEDDNIRLALIRFNDLKEFNIRFRKQVIVNYNLRKVKKPTKLQKKIYEGWLGVRW
jgi:predicted metalloprotease with PDZ domain